jgi:hypothetical protein
MTKRILTLGQVPYTTLIESLVKAIEGKFGDKVECVQIHEKDSEFLNHKTRLAECSILDTDLDVVKTIYKPEKKKGHERPYKYHP